MPADPQPSRPGVAGAEGQGAPTSLPARATHTHHVHTRTRGLGPHVPRKPKQPSEASRGASWNLRAPACQEPALAASRTQAAGGIQSPQPGNMPQSRGGSPPSTLAHQESPQVGTGAPLFPTKHAFRHTHTLLTLALHADQGNSAVFAQDL